ncbi:MAG: hypothetical protein HYX57_12650 [Chloroflexi bacterium]|nr:hypothetical protein [Chloroflexota bacterium]
MRLARPVAITVRIGVERRLLLGRQDRDARDLERLAVAERLVTPRAPPSLGRA